MTGDLIPLVRGEKPEKVSSRVFLEALAARL